MFDSTGRYLGPVEFEGAERVGWIAPVIADGQLYVVTRDELDVHRVRAFRIEGDVERLETDDG